MLTLIKFGPGDGRHCGVCHRTDAICLADHIELAARLSATCVCFAVKTTELGQATPKCGQWIVVDYIARREEHAPELLGHAPKDPNAWRHCGRTQGRRH